MRSGRIPFWKTKGQEAHPTVVEQRRVITSLTSRTPSPHLQVFPVTDRRQIQDRVKTIKATRQILSNLSRQSIPKGLSREQQSELQKYNKWLSSACAKLDKLSKQGENLVRQNTSTQKTDAMLKSFNLQYLQLQNDMQKDNRQFTMVSNIMKVKHDTASGAIRNMR